MRDGANHSMTVENDTKCLATCPMKAVCAKLEYDGGVPFPEDLLTTEGGNVYYGEDPHISKRICQRSCTRVTPGNAPRLPRTSSDREEHGHVR